MNLNLDRVGNLGNGNMDVWKPGGSAGEGQASKGPGIHSHRPLTIQTSAATPEEIAAAGIPESALTRSDALGALVSSAFALPPPPMPAFAAVENLV